MLEELSADDNFPKPLPPILALGLAFGLGRGLFVFNVTDDTCRDSHDDPGPPPELVSRFRAAEVVGRDASPRDDGRLWALCINVVKLCGMLKSCSGLTVLSFSFGVPICHKISKYSINGDWRAQESTWNSSTHSCSTRTHPLRVSLPKPFPRATPLLRRRSVAEQLFCSRNLCSWIDRCCKVTPCGRSFFCNSGLCHQISRFPVLDLDRRHHPRIHLVGLKRRSKKHTTTPTRHAYQSVSTAFRHGTTRKLHQPYLLSLRQLRLAVSGSSRPGFGYFDVR